MKLFKAQNIILFVIALAMLNNVEHLAWVHHSISRLSFASAKLNWIHSIVVVVILEIVIIVLVHFGLKKFAGFYTFMLLCLQLIYYPIGEYWEAKEYAKLAASIIYSVMFTISVYYFSVMRASKSEGNTKLDEYKNKFYQASKNLEQFTATVKQVKAELHESTESLKQSEAELQQVSAELQQKDAELQQLKEIQEQFTAACTCEHCGRVFPSEAAKRSHVGKCPDKQKGNNGEYRLIGKN